jgi:glutamate-1-semialdehyde 2,1-aminomutase
VTLGIPGSAGVPKGAVADTIVVPFNDLDAMRAAFDENKGQIAAVILEPIPANMGVVLPRPAYLPVLRSVCDEHGALLIFDEVVTGFRVARGGAQQLFGVKPDLTCLGKIAGGGLPMGIYGGRAAVMNKVAPEGPVYQAGTLSGNPIATTAGLATLRLATDDVYAHLAEVGTTIKVAAAAALSDAGVPHAVQSAGTMFSVFFAEGPIRDYAAAQRQDTAAFAAFFHAMLDRGVYLPPSAYEAWFVSAAHDERAVQTVLDALPPAAHAAAQAAATAREGTHG